MVSIEQIVIDNIVESMPLGLMVINATGEIVVVNAALANILGHAREELLAKGWGELFFAEEGNEEFNQVILDVIHRESLNLRRVVPYSMPGEGERKRLSMTSSFLRRGKRMAGIVLLVEDVSEAQAQHEREKDLLNERNALQQERVEGLRKLALSVAHQVRNPILSIGGFANLTLREGEIPAGARERLEIILDETVKLETLVKAVSRYASLPQAKLRPIAAPALLAMAVKDMESRAAAGGKRVNARVQCPNMDVAVDPELFKRGLDHILANALDFCVGEEARVDIEARPDAEGVTFLLLDRGQGIAEKDMPYIFDPFFTTKAAGVGMGLCEARQILLEHHGSIKVESRVGAWTKVSLRVPVGERG